MTKIMLNQPSLSPLWPTYPEITRLRLIYDGASSYFLEKFLFFVK